MNKIPLPKNSSKHFHSNLFLYFIAFIEGGVLLAAEVCSAKLIETQLGVSLYVWSSILCTTLLGLAIGYFLGGYFVKVRNPKNPLFYYLFLGGAFVFAMPKLSYYSLQLFMNFGSLQIATLSTVIFLLPPIVLLGCVSPTLIELSTAKFSAGKIAGRILCVSTLGGVLGVLITVFILMPNKGLNFTCTFLGAVLIIVSILLKFSHQKSIPTFVFVGLATLALMSFGVIEKEERNKQLFRTSDQLNKAQYLSSTTLYDKTGVFGAVRVVDYKVKFSNIYGGLRVLFVNNTIQTITTDNGQSLLSYTEFMKGIFKAFPDHDEVLHIGLGGGIVSNYLSKQNRRVTAIEIDQNVVQAALKFFDLSPSVKLVLDDGRHYLNKAKTAYDIVVLNAFNSGIPPWNLFTTESFRKCYETTKMDGLLVVEIGGIVKGTNDLILSSINKTIKEAGWNTKLFRTSSSDSDYIAVGYKEVSLDISSWMSMVNGRKQYMIGNEIQQSLLDQEEAIVFTDDNPALFNIVSKRLVK